jgi:hypothetical protein
MSRRYRHRDGIVHLAADLGTKTHITVCERVYDKDVFISEDLAEVDAIVTCARCLGAPQHMHVLHGHGPA